MMMACKLQDAIVSSHSRITGQFTDKEGAPKARASVVVHPVAAPETLKTKVPELITTYVPPPRPLTEKVLEIVDRKALISSGNFGSFGGKFVPETLVTCLSQLEAEFKKIVHDQVFQVKNSSPISHNQSLFKQNMSINFASRSND